MPARRTTRTPRRLEAEALRWSPPRGVELPPDTSGSNPEPEVIGQRRALKALRMGLELDHHGYNVFVCGVVGTGKSYTVKRALDQLKPTCRLSSDLCYVHNFDHPERPILLALPRGQAPEFRDALRAVVGELTGEIETIVNSDEAKRRKERIRARFERKSLELAAGFKERVEAAGFVLAQFQAGVQMVPDLLYPVDGEAVRIAELEALAQQGALSAEEAARARSAYTAFASELADVIAEQHRIGRQYGAAVDASDREAVALILEGQTRALKRQFPGENVSAWLQQLREAILDHLEVFLRPESPEVPEGEAAPEPPEPQDLPVFDVNVILTGTGDECPIVIENNPTWANLFGSQESIPLGPGSWGTDFLQLRPGSMIRAQGGYLILNAEDVLKEQGVWTQLKRCLRHRELVIQAPESGPQPGSPRLSPEPIPISLKVILVGSYHLYHELVEKDPEFSRIFKVKADFDTSVDCTPDELRRYLDVLVNIVREDGLRDLDRGAVVEILRRSSREAEHNRRLSTRFSPIADLMREADWQAAKEGAPLVTEAHVKQAVADRRERLNLYEEMIGRRIVDGDVIIEVQGARVGQVNGLTVLGTGEYDFGKPSRITCAVGVGKSGLVSIEREIEMSGATFDKGVLVIQGFFTHRFGQMHPVTFAASISFEQSYSYIDGDSASSTEIYVLVSALSRIPLEQGIAVTGSVDQFGRIQPVGGVNEKIEGHFDTCLALGLDGRQGVLVPTANVDELNLADRVLEAVEAGRFHVYPVATIDEGIEVLTGRVAGLRLPNGLWQRGSVNELVQLELERLNDLARESDD